VGAVEDLTSPFSPGFHLRSRTAGYEWPIYLRWPNLRATENPIRPPMTTKMMMMNRMVLPIPRRKPRASSSAAKSPT
jgi:hypothetical protein